MAFARRGRRLRVGRLLAMVSFLGAVVLLVTVLAAGEPKNDENDPENKTYGITYKGNPQTDCWAHHRTWNPPMTDSHVIIPIFPQEIPVGRPSNLELQVFNPWKSDISEVKVQLELGNETFLTPLVGQAASGTPDLHLSWSGTLFNPRTNVTGTPVGVPGGSQVAGPNSVNLTFDVAAGVTAVFGHLELYYPTGFQQGVPLQDVDNRLSAKFFIPQGSRAGHDFEPKEPNTTARDFKVPTGEGLRAIAPNAGPWRIQLVFEQGAPRVEYYVNLTAVYRNVGANTFNVFEQLRDPADPKEDPRAFIKPYGVATLPPIPVQGLERGVQLVKVRMEARVWYPHDDRRTPSEDSFVRVATVPVRVGDQFLPSAAQTVTSTGGQGASFYVVAGEVAGFSGAILLPPSLLLGGTYGRASRKLFNALLGGAKRRVMFHNLLSLGLTFIALVHIVFFLIESNFTVLMGVLWGGLASLSLLVLGLTGYYQVPLIQKYGYRWWRIVHLTFGIIVVLLVAYHSLADGDDFPFVKHALPQWINDINLVQK